MPLREMAVPKRPTLCRPKRPVTMPVAGQESAPRNGLSGRFSRGAPRAELCDGALQPLLRRFELSDELRVQIAPRVDGLDQRRPRGNGPVDRRAGADGAVLQPRDLLGLGFERLALGGERGQRPLVLLHALPIEPIHRGRRAVGTADRLQVVEIEQQPPVAGASQLVQLDEAGLDIRTFGVRGVSKRRRTGDRRGQLRLRPAQGDLDRREILGLQLALDLERAELDEQGLLLRGQRLGFALQRADPVGDALGDRVGARAIGRRRLREEAQGSPPSSGRRGRPERRDQKSGLPSMSPGIGRPKYFSTVGAMSMMDRPDAPRRAIGRLEISTPAVVAAS